MARMNAASTDLASTEAAQLCDDLLRACTVSAVHLEMRDDYAPGDSWFRAWRHGDQEEFERQLARPWLQAIREITGRGVAVRRLRVVSEPVTDYIRFEHATTDSNIDAGEEVRWLPRRQAADLLLPGCDCWVFDGRRVLFNFFDGPGEWAGAAVCDDAGSLRATPPRSRKRGHGGVPHADYRLS